MSDAYERMKRLREQNAQEAVSEQARRREEAAAQASRTSQRLCDLRDILVAEGVSPLPLYVRTVDYGTNHRRNRVTGQYPLDVHTHIDSGQDGWLLADAGFAGDESHDWRHEPPILTTRGEAWKGSRTKESAKRDKAGHRGQKVSGLSRGPGLGGRLATRGVVYMPEWNRAISIGDLDEDRLAAWYLKVVQSLTR